MNIELLKRELEREKLAREETEKILEQTTFQLYLMNQELQKTLQENELLLRQYKDAVDEGSIFSKTDVRGVITYVNDEFCRISGYSREELIGKKHNLVRHPDTKKETFDEMWTFLKSKHSWKGFIQNRAKDGRSYFVKAMIKPILDEYGNIQEYIALREDVTELMNLHEEIISTQKEMLERLGELAETRSQETGFHVKRVAEYSRLLASKYGLSEEEVELLKQASPMHDVGKIAIPDNILNKPGALTPEEFEIMKTHALKGHEVFKSSKHLLLKAASIVSLEHHEKYDGSGYPYGLKGEEIHIYGRITAIADVFDALGSDRIYKKAWPIEKILDFLKEQRGKHFDPVLIDIFFDNFAEFDQVRKSMHG